MQRKKSRLYGIVCALIILFWVAWAVLFLQINHRYPQASIQQFPPNTDVAYGSLLLNTGVCYFMTEQGLSAAKMYQEGSLGCDIYALIVPISVINPSENEISLELYTFMSESKYWDNGINLEAFMALNGESASLTPTVDAGATLSVSLPFFLPSAMYTPDTWNSILTEQYSLVVSLYPEKKSLLLITE